MSDGRWRRWLLGTPEDWQGVWRAALAGLVFFLLGAVEIVAFHGALTSGLITVVLLIDAAIALGISAALRKRRG